ncbi:YitT family protein [Sphingomonas sp. AP4-R1]|uniref:YitT family protein n=1 Tax=Sphingomonas sp. AP4-R1 TaxID=2735134 RepID=UPI001493D4C4|nr:YitT family protein [Sphingomonas sp. AP4-R1]QJU58742.1 YitT family protein [Sphingomonas sp. AP4-R1]
MRNHPLSESPAPPPSERAVVPQEHHWGEDVYALAVGWSLVMVGLMLLQAAKLVTGGVAGVALLLRYLVPLPVGLLLAGANLPFLILAARTMGAEFTIKTILLNVALAGLSGFAPQMMQVLTINPAFAALVGGSAIGMGVLALARHQSGVGGFGVVALWLYRSRGLNAGRTQMTLDACVLAASAFVVPWDRLGWSIVSAVALNGIMIVWHRPGRYTGY